MNHAVRILSICDDDGLRLSRELLLKNRGYEIESITSNEALSPAEARSFDIVLISRSVDTDRAVVLAGLLRNANPGIQIICIAPIGGQSELGSSDLELGPEPLLEAIRALCNQIAAHKGDARFLNSDGHARIT